MPKSQNKKHFRFLMPDLEIDLFPNSNCGPLVLSSARSDAPPPSAPQRPLTPPDPLDPAGTALPSAPLPPAVSAPAPPPKAATEAFPHGPPPPDGPRWIDGAIQQQQVSVVHAAAP